MNRDGDELVGVTRPVGVVFDVNETLVDLSGLARVFTDLGLAPTGLDWWFAALVRDGVALAASGDYGSFAALAAVALEEVMAGSGLPSTAAAIETLLATFAELPLHQDVAPALAALRGANVALFALTNGSADVTRALLERAGVSELLSVHSVEAAGLWKPRAEAYHSLSDELALANGDLALVAVHPWDLHGASAAGLLTAWPNRRARTYPGVFRAPTVTGTDLLDVATRLLELPACRRDLT